MALWNRNSASVPPSSANADAERLYRESLMNTGPIINQATLLPADRRITTSGPFGSYEPDYSDPLESPRARQHMLAMRLRIKEGQRLPFDDIHTSLGKEKVVVFIMQNDQAVILEDDRNLFPSDTLVTQLRLIAK